MSALTVLSIINNAGALLETLVAAQVAGDERAEAKVATVFGIIDTVGGIAGHGLAADASLAEKLEPIAIKLEALNAGGGDLVEEDFAAVGRETRTLEAELQATLARRRALAG